MLYSTSIWRYLVTNVKFVIWSCHLWSANIDHLLKMPCSAENPWVLTSMQMPNTVVDRVHPIMANCSPRLQRPPQQDNTPCLTVYYKSPYTESSSFCAITNFLLFCLAGTLCYVSTSTLRPNLHWWPCRSQNERRKEDGMRREDRRKWGARFNAGTSCRVGALLCESAVDGPVLGQHDILFCNKRNYPFIPPT